MATIATMAMLMKPAKIVASTSGSGSNKVAPSASMSLRSVPTKKSGLAVAASSSSPLAAALAGAFFSALASSDDAALAAQQVAGVAAAAVGDDNRGTLLLVVVAPAIGWVLYNILQPALNQLNRMRSQAVVAGLGGLGAAAAAGLACAPEASAAAAVRDLVASLAEADAAAASDNRGTLLLIVVAPAIAWVLYNILQPALNQLNRMRND